MAITTKLRILVAFSLLLATSSVGAQSTILFHGGGTAPDSGADADVFDFLIEKFGEGNVTYMQGDMAAADGSSAAGFDGVVISSTLGSGTVRNKYEDSLVPVLQWEEALVRGGAAGNFFMSEASRNTGGEQFTEIVIEQEHFITAGFGVGSTVEVINAAAPQTFSVASGAVGEGVEILASITGNNGTEWALMVADEGGALLGDGSDGMPDVALSRRVHMWWENGTFAEANDNGRELFSRSLDWLLRREGFAGDVDENGVVNRDDFDIISGNFGLTEQGRTGGDLNFTGEVDLGDFREWKNNEGNVLPPETAAVPEPATIVLLLLAATPLWRRAGR